ncbi:MAG: GNAT family N-acetyltransferase [Janthinobacterium lividum]
MILTDVAAAELLAALHEQCFPPGECWDQAAMTGLLTVPGCFAFVAAGGPEDRPSGMALVRVAADEAELLTIGVVPGARRQGVADRLLTELTASVRARGAVRLFLEVSVANTSALALYRAHGFVEVGRRRRYYPDDSDALVMSRTLAGLSAA